MFGGQSSLITPSPAGGIYTAKINHPILPEDRMREMTESEKKKSIIHPPHHESHGFYLEFFVLRQIVLSC